MHYDVVNGVPGAWSESSLFSSLIFTAPSCSVPAQGPNLPRVASQSTPRQLTTVPPARGDHLS